VEEWSLIRALHVLALAFFVGGQLVLVAAIVPAMRRRDDDASMRAIAKRFGIGSVVALLVLIATGAAMAGHFARWDDPALHVKLALLVLVGVLLVLHIVTPYTRAISTAVLVTSLAIVWFGVELTHG
jgi:uncharacterized membrane protein